MKTETYDAIDLVKLIFSILIVALHSEAIYDISSLANLLLCEGIARLGVPFFFTASAFFLFRKPVTWDATRKYCKRLLTLYVSWFIVSIPKTVFDRFICSDYTIGITILRFLRSFFVTSTFSGSWFITSCIFCALFYYWLSRFPVNAQNSITIVVSVVVYIWITFCSAYGNLMEDFGLGQFYNAYEMLLANPYLSFLVGIPYFSLGRHFAERYQGEKRYIGKKWCGGAICVTLLLVEVFLCNNYSLSKSTDCYFMLLPCIYVMFPIVLSINMKLKHAKTLRITSTIIFFSQFLLLFVCEVTEWAFKITIPHLGKFTFAVLFGVIVTWVILKLQDKKGFYWVRRFY